MDTSRTRIVLVDDEENQRVTLRNILLMEGFDVFCAASGPEVLKVLEHFRAHVVLSDLRMPDMNGMELLRIIKDRHPATTVIIMTAYACDETRTEALSRGAAAYLAKPIDFKELLRNIPRSVAV